MTKANALRALHIPGTPVVLPNAWDAASARSLQEAGFPAVATTSGGVAAVLGFDDGEKTPADQMLAAVARIAAAVDVPVTADLEAGYGMTPEEITRALIDSGAVGMNHEDSNHATGTIRDVEEQASRIAAIKDAGGDSIVLNARIDVYLPRLGGNDRPADEVLEDALARARAYRAAGADCVFPIFCRDEKHIEALVQVAPINILAIKGAPSIPRLAELGVARVSFGSGMMSRAMAAFERDVAAVKAGRYPWD